MSKRPVIGITTDSNDAEDRYMSTMTYSAAVERAGGLPLLLPYRVDHHHIPQYVDLLDGVLFSGGNDMHPCKYSDEDWHPHCQRMDPFRQEFEFTLIHEVEKRRMPTLGVCFGSQLMNVYRGGTLHQFLPDHKRENALEHRRIANSDPERHPIDLDINSQLGRAIGKREVSVNTYHKQAVCKIGKGLKVIATAPDGVIEAFEDPTLPLFAAVQWHPERLIEEKEHLAPFRLLVERAAELRKG
ncbi:MAG TPA: gamma-glutamyl-gamma-aminobutyrate hydrolase family protein [Tepidisphaeraceae bacterium]|jgi:putative glutamine amidotransferase